MMDEQEGNRHTHARTHTRWFCCFSDRMPCDSDPFTGSVFIHLTAPYSSLLLIKLIQVMLKPQRSKLIGNYLFGALMVTTTVLFPASNASLLHQHFGGLFDLLCFWPHVDLRKQFSFSVNYNTNTSTHWLPFWETCHFLGFFSLEKLVCKCTVSVWWVGNHVLTLRPCISVII